MKPILGMYNQAESVPSVVAEGVEHHVDPIRALIEALRAFSGLFGFGTKGLEGVRAIGAWVFWLWGL